MPRQPSLMRMGMDGARQALGVPGPKPNQYPPPPQQQQGGQPMPQQAPQQPQMAPPQAGGMPPQGQPQQGPPDPRQMFEMLVRGGMPPEKAQQIVMRVMQGQGQANGQ